MPTPLHDTDIKEWRITKIIYFTLHTKNPQKFGQKLSLTNKVPLRATNNTTKSFGE